MDISIWYLFIYPYEFTFLDKTRQISHPNTCSLIILYIDTIYGHSTDLHIDYIYSDQTLLPVSQSPCVKENASFLLGL